MPASNGNRHDMPDLRGLMIAHEISGSQAEMAEWYGVSPQTIRRWAKRLGADIIWTVGRPKGKRNLI